VAAAVPAPAVPVPAPAQVEDGKIPGLVCHPRPNLLLENTYKQEVDSVDWKPQQKDISSPNILVKWSWIYPCYNNRILVFHKKAIHV
jgi:hypothetical protein